jgi:hypothetical protein
MALAALPSWGYRAAADEVGRVRQGHLVRAGAVCGLGTAADDTAAYTGVDEMSRPNDGAIWATRLNDEFPYQYIQAKNGDVYIGFFPGAGQPGVTVTITRADARLLAKRINQCLDDTRKK